MSDPKLKEAMAEIMGVLKKHDIAGQVTLASQTHSEFRVKLDASWSCIFPENKPQGVSFRFRCKKSEIPDVKVRHKLVEESMHILCQFRDMNAQYFMAFEDLIKTLSAYVDFDHKPGSGYEPHVEK